MKEVMEEGLQQLACYSTRNETGNWTCKRRGRREGLQLAYLLLLIIYSVKYGIVMEV